MPRETRGSAGQSVGTSRLAPDDSIERVAINPANRCASSIQGQLLRLSARREVAIYLRKDTLWVADFVDGHGELIRPTTWFRFNCGVFSTPDARRRMVHEAAIPLSGELVERIEDLHRLGSVQTDSALIPAVGADSPNGPRNALARILRKLFMRRPTIKRTRRDENASV